MTSRIGMVDIICHATIFVCLIFAIGGTETEDFIRKATKNYDSNFRESWDSILLRNIQLNDYLHTFKNFNYGYLRITENRRGEDKTPVSSVWTCEICKVVVAIIQEGLKQKKSEDEIAEVVRFLCIEFKYEDEKVCTGMVNVNKAEILTVALDIGLSPEGVCGIVIGGTCGGPYLPITNWTVPLLNTTKPPVVPPVPPQPGSPTLRVLHLTDIHLDLLYKEGVNAECGEPLCCRVDNGPPAPGVPGAGYWGDYRVCNTPMRLLENLFQTLAKMQDQFDFVIWTGDMHSQSGWNYTREGQLRMIQIIQGMFRKYLPNTPVFPSVGNHESCPVYSFPPPFITGDQSIEWLYKPLSESWLNWLPADTLPDLLRGAYYTVSPFPGFRIISINDNYCPKENRWLLINMTDPTGQLAWLIDVLQDAEDKNEKVYILGHIPTAYCMKSWSWTYYKIINRYESTVMAQFFGHDHTDEFELFYDDVNFTRPISISYVAPSVTTNFDLNPGFRIYTMDGNYPGTSWAILDHDTYIFNISDANAGNRPVWFKEYSAKATYGMKGLYPADWNDLVQRIEKDENLFNKFYYYYKKGHMKAGECSDAKCRLDIICSLKTARSDDSANLCRDL